MEKATLDDIIQLNAFTSRMRDNSKFITCRTHKEITKYIADIGEKIRLIRNFLRLKDEEWSLELAMSGLEFGENEFYRQLRASKSQYKPYYKIINTLLFLREGMDKYLEKKYVSTYVNKDRAEKILARINETIENAWIDVDTSDLKECARVLNDVITSAEF